MYANWSRNHAGLNKFTPTFGTESRKYILSLECESAVTVEEGSNNNEYLSDQYFDPGCHVL